MSHLFERSLWSRQLSAWYLYDLSNSVISVVFQLYFSQWIVIDQGYSDFSYSLPIILSTIILMFISSMVGTWGDKTGKHHWIFAITSLGAAMSAVLVVGVGRLLPGPSKVILGLIFFGVFQFFYQLALVPYYAFMKHLCPQEGYGRASGIGFAVSQVGYLLGLAVGLPLVGGVVPILGSDRLAPLIGGAMVFLLLAWVPITVLPKQLPRSDEPSGGTKRIWWRAFWEDLQYSRKFPGVFALLLSFYVFSDAMMSINVFGAIYLERAFHVADQVKTNMFGAVIIGFAIGSWGSAWIADRLGHRRVLIFALFLTAATGLTAAGMRSPELILPVFFVLGIGMGGGYAASRSYLASLIPIDESGKFFGLYVFAERFASIIGPLIWSGVVYAFSSSTPLNYRYALSSMAILVLVSILPIIRAPARWRGDG